MTEITASPEVIEAAKNIEVEIPMPVGYRIEVDHKTDNILVIGKNFGFAVTRLFIRDHDDYLTTVRVHLNNLREAEESGHVPRPNYTLDELAKQRDDSEVFDD